MCVEQAVLDALERADCITSSLSGIKVFPMTGSTIDWIDKKKLHGMFESIFVSCRAAEVVNRPGFGKLFRQEGDGASRRPVLLAVETAKFLVPFASDKKSVVVNKIEEYAAQLNMMRLAGTSSLPMISCTSIFFQLVAAK